MTATRTISGKPLISSSNADTLKLQSSMELTIPPSGSDQLSAQAIQVREQLKRDVQTELAIDSAYRAKEQELLLAQDAARKINRERDNLSRQLTAQESNTSRWQLISGGGLLSTLLVGALWLRSRRQLSQESVSPDSSGIGELFDSSRSLDSNTLAAQSALLPDAEFQNTNELDIQDGLWSGDGREDFPAHATLHEFSDSAPHQSATPPAKPTATPTAIGGQAVANAWQSTTALPSTTAQQVQEPVADSALVNALANPHGVSDQASATSQQSDTVAVTVAVGAESLEPDTASMALEPTSLSPTSLAPTDTDSVIEPPSAPPAATLASMLGGAAATTREADPSSAVRAQALTPPAAAPTPIKDLRQALFNSLKRDPSTKTGASSFAATAMPSEADLMLSEGSVFRELPDVQWVPQPMQDLLLLYRGLQEWVGEARFGVAEQAILHHINLHTATSGWVYLELLHIYRRQDNRKAFDRWADTFRARFNRLAPTWLDAQDTGKDLLRYDLATLQLTQAWSNNSVIWLLEEWLVGEPHMRRLMDIHAFRDVLMLYELSLMVNDNPYKPIERPSRAAARALAK